MTTETPPDDDPDAPKSPTDAASDGTVSPAVRVKRLEQRVAALQERLGELEADSGRDGVSRRSLLGALGIAGLAGLGVSTASADPQGQIGTASDPLADLYTLNVQSPDDRLLLLVGGSVAGVIDFDGQNPDTIFGAAQALGNTSAGRTISGGASHEASGELSTVSGGYSSLASGYISTVGGGRNNEASDHYTTVGGGDGNTASFSRATVAGGGSNTADGGGATVGGGTNNQAMGYQSTVAGGGDRNDESQGNAAYTNYSTVAGGRDNEAGTEGAVNVDVAATVGGGEANRASADHATIPGGQDNIASGPNSFAAGTNAMAENEGAFVWCDVASDGIRSLNPNEFVVGASGGIHLYSNADTTTGVRLPSGSGSWQTASSRTLKSDIEPVGGEDILERVTDLEISRWSYDSQDGVRHLGPMAEEFHDAFGLGEDDEHISAVDADGVALGAIQGLAERLDAREARIEELEDAVAERDDRIDDLESETEGLRDRLDALESRIEAEEPGAAR